MSLESTSFALLYKKIVMKVGQDYFPVVNLISALIKSGEASTQVGQAGR